MPPTPPVLEGTDISLSCHVTEGYETPAISWFKNGLPIQASDEIKIKPESLHIRNAKPIHSGEYKCRAVNSWGNTNQGTNVWIRKRTKILSEPVYLEYSTGDKAVLDCTVEVDENLRSSLSIKWYRGEELLQVSRSSLVPSENSGFGDYDEEPARFLLHHNHSLEISKMLEEDVGTYRCQASTELEPMLQSEPSQIFLPSQFPYLLVILVIVAIFLIVLLFFCIWRIRRRNQGKGYYGVKDIEKTGAKHNRSDIYYTTEDGDSVMNEQDNLPINNSTPVRTPIFTPKTIRHISNLDKSAGSVGSLLEDDEFLRRGMDEDGSFRERYAD